VEVVSGGINFGGTLTAPDFGGTGSNNVLDAGEVLLDRGINAVASLDGRQFTADGLNFKISTTAIDLEFSLDNNTTFTVNQTFSFRVANLGGLKLQLGDGDPTTEISISLPDLTSANLGAEAVADLITRAKGNAAPTGSFTKGGFLSSLKTGETNSLTNDAQNASFIVKQALDQVAKARGRIGGTVANTIEPIIQAQEVEIENLGASLSTIRDLDFAEETSNFTKRQILFQSSIAVLASANLVPQSVLALLR
jgi:flagellin